MGRALPLAHPPVRGAARCSPAPLWAGCVVLQTGGSMAATIVAARIRRSWFQRLSVIDLFLWGLRAAALAAVAVGTFATPPSGRYAGEGWLDFLLFAISQASVCGRLPLGYTVVSCILRM